MLEPRPPRNPARVEPIRFHLQKLLIQPLHLLRRIPAGSQTFFDRLPQLISRLLKFRDAFMELFQLQLMRIRLVLQFQVRQKMLQHHSVETEVIRQHIRVGQPQRHQSPDVGQRDVIFEGGIADVLHPVMIVVHRVIHAVITSKPEVDHRPAQMIQKHRVV